MMITRRQWSCGSVVPGLVIGMHWNAGRWLSQVGWSPKESRKSSWNFHLQRLLQDGSQISLGILGAFFLLQYLNGQIDMWFLFPVHFPSCLKKRSNSFEESPWSIEAPCRTRGPHRQPGGDGRESLGASWTLGRGTCPGDVWLWGVWMFSAGGAQLIPYGILYLYVCTIYIYTYT